MKKNGRWRYAAYVLTGMLAGAANGLFGGGGGMLVVPCLRYIGGFDEKHSHATSIAVVMPLSFLSVLVYTVKGVSEFTLAWQVGLGVIVGGVIGALLLKRMQKSLLNLLFYGMMIYVGVRFIR